MLGQWRAVVAAGVAATAVVAPVDGPGQEPLATTEALASADEFLDRYLQPSGRIARTNEGGDTVSEGQAYGMLLAVALEDEERFRAMWAWTDEHLQRDDGLLAWQWADGGIADYQAASDADVIAAAALAMAAERFDDPDLLANATLISDAVMAHETVVLGESTVLVAGPWARRGRVVNPSYWVTPAMSQLWWSIGEERWGSVAASSRNLLDRLTADPPHLPPDWATVDDSGNPIASTSPAGDSPRYGYEAGRVLVQMAVDCRQSGQQLAARAWPILAELVDTQQLATSLTLDGEPLSAELHPLSLVAAAAAAAAAGDREDAGALLDLADSVDDEAPTYYGAAWIALARVWLDTDLLGGCRPGEPTTA